MTDETLDQNLNVQDADTPTDLPENSDLPNGGVTSSEDDIDPSGVAASTLPDSGAPPTTDGVRGVDPPMSGTESSGTSDRATGVTTLRG